MKKILIAITLMIAILLPSQTSARGELQYFEDAVDYANFMRIYLAVCPELDQNPSALSKMPKNKRDIASKICTPEIKSDVKQNLKFMIAINIYGSIDIKRNEYNLPGTKEQDTFREPTEQEMLNGNFIFNYDKTINLFNQDTWKLLSDPKKSINKSAKEILNNISEADINEAVERIFSSCSKPGTSDYKLCNDLLNIQEPDKNNNIFNPNNLNNLFLQQMFFNMHTNALNGANNIPTHVTFKIFNDDFRYNILYPTIDFGNNFNFNFAEITPDKTALSKVKTHYVPGGSGVIIDQFAELATRAAEGMYNTIANWFLNIRLETISDPSVKNVWQAFRDLSNIIFIIIFLVVIISQITGVGLSNYSVKRMLPKLLIAILLVNLSFYITQVAVDLSNLIGKGIFQLLVDTAKISGGFMGKYGIYTSKQGSIGDILNILMLIIAGLLTVLATLINILLLTIRDAVVIILVITSPFALVSGLSPQMQKIHDTWWKLLFNIASIYPIASFLVGGAILVDQIIMSGQDGMIMFLTAKLALFGSLTAIPFIILNAMRKIDSAVKVGGTGSLFNTPLAHNIGSDPISAGVQAKNLFDKTGVGQFRLAQKQQKKLLKRASRTGKFWARDSLNAQYQLKKQRSDLTGKFSQAEAGELIDALSTNNFASLSPELRNKYQVLANQIIDPKEIALSLAMAYAQDASSQKEDNPDNILKALNLANKRGATQAELQDTTTEIMKALDNKGDFRSMGIIKATAEYNEAHGKANLNLLHQADQLSNQISDPTAKPYHELIVKHTTESMKDKGLFTKLESGNMENLHASTIQRGTVANEVFIKHMADNSSTRDAILNNYHKLSTETQDVLGASTELLDKLQQANELQAKVPSPVPKTRQVHQLRQTYTTEFAKKEQEYINDNVANYSGPTDPLLISKAKAYARQATEDLFNELSDTEQELSDIQDIIKTLPQDNRESIKQDIMDSIKYNNHIT